MVPCDSKDIRKEYAVLLNELEQYNPELLDKERVLAITKCDLLDKELLDAMKGEVPRGVCSIFISSATGMGIDRLKDALWEVLNKPEPS
jgi:GTP-binding protein